ncbi:MAG: ABC transporter permease subunit, partial [Acetobacteraceae bacterium]|nr:ABC transporter permease subunit [Acetobacteraceae bacterium]
TLRTIVLPLLAPAIGAGAIFAFTISFDELIVALFIAGPEQFTLPRQMLASAREYLSPTLAVAAVLVSLASLLLLGFYAVLQRGR